MALPFVSELKSIAPKDKYSIIALIFLINGIGTLLPWNMLINADDYFVNYKLNVTSPSSAVQNYRYNFLSYLGIASKAPNILVQILNMFINAENANLSRRISVTLVMQILVFLFIIVLACLDTSNCPDIFFWLTMASAIVINLANGVYQGCIYGLAARFPMRYTNLVTIGMNISGTIASLLMLLSIVVSPSYQMEAIIFFFCAVILLFFCLIAEIFVDQNRFYRFYAKRDNDSIELTSCPSCFQNGSKDGVCTASHLRVAIVSSPTYGDKITNTTANNNNNNGGVEAGGGGSSSSIKRFSKANLSSTWIKYRYIFKQIWVQLVNTILIYTVSLSLFPAVNARIFSTDHWLSERYFAPVFCFLLFNFFATVGNFIAQYIQWPGPRYLIIFALARIAFVPFFLYCNYYPTDHRTLPVIFDRDWMFVLGSVAMAITSGYFSSLTMMYIPKCVRPELSATAGMLGALTIILGILIGINLSLVYPLMVA